MDYDPDHDSLTLREEIEGDGSQRQEEHTRWKVTTDSRNFHSR
jgi:hypothetical protein